MYGNGLFYICLLIYLLCSIIAAQQSFCVEIAKDDFHTYLRVNKEKHVQLRAKFFEKIGFPKNW